MKESCARREVERYPDFETWLADQYNPLLITKAKRNLELMELKEVPFKLWKTTPEQSYSLAKKYSLGS